MSEPEEKYSSDGSVVGKEEFAITPSLEDLQTDEQRQVLDTVAQVRKCGLDNILSLPQLVVCGDQSAGKSSLLEALTGIPFPRNDNLCTRFATEIILRRGPSSTLTIRVIPDGERSEEEQATIKAFVETIDNFEDLPHIMDKAKVVMGIATEANPDDDDDDDDDGPSRAFAKDTLSIEIEGPTRPQLTVVDLPGLIQTSTKGVTDADVDLVSALVDSYLEQPRTICLATVSAANDAANQLILRKVRKVDPEGERTLGVITKPDLLPAGSGMETKFLELARNEDVYFKLGWHVVRNRRFEERDLSSVARDAAEKAYFRSSRFASLPPGQVGITTLRARLSELLLAHVQRELPKLRQDLDKALEGTRADLDRLGPARSQVPECRTFLTQLSVDYHDLAKAAVDGYYENKSFFDFDTSRNFSPNSDAAIPRLRAVIQLMNTRFADRLHNRGHKYHIDMSGNPPEVPASVGNATATGVAVDVPTILDRGAALNWVRQTLLRNRGRELTGEFNPLLIGELFQEQSSFWERLATEHLQDVARVCERFVRLLLDHKAPPDVRARLWSFTIAPTLQRQRKEAMDELGRLMEDNRRFPINYNDFYTQTIEKGRQKRDEDRMSAAIGQYQQMYMPQGHIDPAAAGKLLSGKADHNMEDIGCAMAVESLLAIYKVMLETFVANITTQVIERHMISSIQDIFGPVIASKLSDAHVKSIATEPSATVQQRDFLVDRINKLEEGKATFEMVMGK